MNIFQNVPLKNLTTMQLGGNAKIVKEVFTPEEVAEAVRLAKSENQPFFVIGDGSNIIAHDEGFNGIIIKVKIPGFEIVSENKSGAKIKIGAGENWDSAVKRAVDKNLSGIEAMSWIPGTTGAAPVQNTGAYGQEIADVLVSVEAYDCEKETFVTLSKAECNFNYRHSVFKDEYPGRYILTSITINLGKENPKPPFYDSIEKYFAENNITQFTPKLIRDTVIMMRREKLPDPSIMPNSGSFFHNTIVSAAKTKSLKQKYPELPIYPAQNGNYKIPTGWLIEQAELKGKMLHGMKVHDKNALVLINQSATSYNDLANARNEIIKTVYEKFGIYIEQEPIEL